MPGEEEGHRPQLSSPLADGAAVEAGTLEEGAGEPARLEDVPGQPAEREDDQRKGQHAHRLLVRGANPLLEVVHVRVVGPFQHVQVGLAVRGRGDDQRHHEEYGHEGEQEDEVEGARQPDARVGGEGEEVQSTDGERVVGGGRVGDVHGEGVAEEEDEQGEEQADAPDAKGDDLHGGGVGDAGAPTDRLPLVHGEDGDGNGGGESVAGG